MPAKRKSASSASSTATIGFEAKLWLTAYKLWNNMDAADWSGATKSLRNESLKGERDGAHQYFLTRFASAEGKNGGPAKCEVRSPNVEVKRLRPFDIRNSTFAISPARRLAIMNLAIRGIEADIGKEHADTFRSVQHPDLRADYVLANPPFNDSDTALRGSAFLQSEAKPQVVSAAKDNFRKDDDARWQFGVPPKGNANFAWVQH